MSDGLFTGQARQEQLQQTELIRHRLLTVNVSDSGFKNPRDSSSYASANPNNLNTATNYAPPEGGPHFTMSPRTPDDSKSYGFEFCLSVKGIPGGEQALSATAPNAPEGPYDVTWWELIGNSFDPAGAVQPLWASFLTQAVNVLELYHSFDVNATALRCQIGNAEPVTTAGGSIMIIFAEL